LRLMHAADVEVWVENAAIALDPDLKPNAWEFLFDDALNSCRVIGLVFLSGLMTIYFS
jgi:hypothetical protein